MTTRLLQVGLPAAIPLASTFAMRAVSGVVAPLPVMDDGQDVGQRAQVVLDRLSNQLPGLRDRQRGAFF